MVCRFKVLPIPGWSLLGLFPVDETSLENLFVERRLSSDPLWPVIRVQPTFDMIFLFLAYQGRTQESSSGLLRVQSTKLWITNKKF